MSTTMSSEKAWDRRENQRWTVLDTTVETKVIEDAVRLACRAPSLYNSQPWLWVADGGRLDLFLDPSRVLHTDRSTREAHISCGAVIDHLGVAMAAAGWMANVDRFPNRTTPSTWRRWSSPPWTRVTDDQRRRADAILKRRTDRSSVHVAVHRADATGNRLSRVNPAESASTQCVWTYRRTRRIHASPRRPRSPNRCACMTPASFRTSWWTAPSRCRRGIPYSALVSAAENDRVGVN